MPSAAVCDSQSVKGGQLPALICGYDAGKKIKGRKRHVLTDTNGLLLGAVVTAASMQDRDGAKLLLCLFCHSFMSLLTIFADGGYAGKLEEFVRGMGRLCGHGMRLWPGHYQEARGSERLHRAAKTLDHPSAASAGWSNNAA